MRDGRSKSAAIRMTMLNACRGNLSWMCHTTLRPVPIDAIETAIPARNVLAWIMSGSIFASVLWSETIARVSDVKAFHSRSGRQANRASTAGNGIQSTPSSRSIRPKSPSSGQIAINSYAGRSSPFTILMSTCSAPLTAPVWFTNTTRAGRAKFTPHPYLSKLLELFAQVSAGPSSVTSCRYSEDPALSIDRSSRCCARRFARDRSARASR